MPVRSNIARTIAMIAAWLLVMLYGLHVPLTAEMRALDSRRPDVFISFSRRQPPRVDEAAYQRWTRAEEAVRFLAPPVFDRLIRAFGLDPAAARVAIRLSAS